MSDKINGKLVYTDKPHIYKYDGVIVPAVNDILQAVGLADYSKINARVIDRARAFGKAVHRATHLWDEHNLNEKTLSAPLVPYLTGWKNLHKDHKIAFLEIEIPRYSALGFAGTMDRYARFDGRKTIIDIKSTKILTLANILQTAGYEILLEEDGIKIDYRIIVQLDPLFKRGYKLYYCEDQSDRNGFMSCFNTYNLQLRAKKGVK